jgi:hypothetical protein
MLARVRIWLPDAPGVLGAVAAEIGALEGNVIGLEVLEREAGVAVDELIMELPDDVGVVDALCRGVRTIPGAGIEEVIELAPGARGAAAGVPEVPDREGGVLEAVTLILAAPTPDTALRALTGSLVSLFSFSWLALMDSNDQFVENHGDLPSAEWVVAFAEGARSGTDPANDTTGSGVFVEPIAGMGLSVCGGRPTAIRRRERREITMLALVASRYIGAMMGQVPAES